MLSGLDRSIELFNDVGSAGRSMGFWTHIIPGVVFTLILFPQQVNGITNSQISDSSVRLIGWILIFGILLRHWLVLS